MADYNWFLSEAEKNYQPTRDAVQSQINAIPGQQQAALADLQKSYDLQNTNLNNQKTTANNAANMSSAMRGGSFGGQANIANEKYYNNTFVPATTQVNNAFQSDTRSTNENYTNRRMSLEQTLASLIDEQRKYAMQQYQTAQDREASERAARAAAAAQSSALSNYFGSPTTNNTTSTGANTPTFRQWLASNPAGQNPLVIQSALAVMGNDGKAGNYWALDDAAKKVAVGPSIYGPTGTTGKSIGNYLYNLYKSQMGI